MSWSINFRLPAGAFRQQALRATGGWSMAALGAGFQGDVQSSNPGNTTDDHDDTRPNKARLCSGTWSHSSERAQLKKESVNRWQQPDMGNQPFKITCTIQRKIKLGRSLPFPCRHAYIYLPLTLGRMSRPW